MSFVSSFISASEDEQLAKSLTIKTKKKTVGDQIPSETYRFSPEGFPIMLPLFFDGCPIYGYGQI